MTSHLLEVQERGTNTLNRIQQQSSIDRYMINKITYTGNNADDFNSYIQKKLQN